MTAPSRWRVLGASMTGALHEARGTPCQDALLWRIFPGDVLVAAVADGAGCAQRGGLGAEVATRSVIEFMSQQDLGAQQHATWRVLLGEALAAARAALTAEAEVCQLGIEELATTLLLVVAAPGMFAAAQVGDGAVVVGNRRLGLTVVTTPHTGECVNETLFLTAPDALAQASITVLHRSFAFLTMLTDGLQLLSLSYPGGAPYPPFFHPLFHFITRIDDAAQAQEQLRAFLASSQVRERTEDDVTLCIAKWEM